VERFPRLLKVQNLLNVLDRAIAEAERQGDPQVVILMARGAGEAQVELRYAQGGLGDRHVNLAEELGLSSGETVGLFRWAEREGYIRPSYDSSGPQAETATAFLEHLESKGYELLGELPDPAERLLLSLQAMEAAIDARQDLRPEQKELATKALEELKEFLRGLPPGIAVEVGSAVFRSSFFGG
jgi:hypothetical protein